MSLLRAWVCLLPSRGICTECTAHLSILWRAHEDHDNLQYNIVNTVQDCKTVGDSVIARVFLLAKYFMNHRFRSSCSTSVIQFKMAANQQYFTAVWTTSSSSSWRSPTARALSAAGDMHSPKCAETEAYFDSLSQVGEVLCLPPAHLEQVFSSPEQRFCRDRISMWRPWSRERCSCRRNSRLLSTLWTCRERLLSSPMAADSADRQTGRQTGRQLLDLFVYRQMKNH